MHHTYHHPIVRAEEIGSPLDLLIWLKDQFKMITDDAQNDYHHLSDPRLRNTLDVFSNSHCGYSTIESIDPCVLLAQDDIRSERYEILIHKLTAIINVLERAVTQPATHRRGHSRQTHINRPDIYHGLGFHSQPHVVVLQQQHEPLHHHHNPDKPHFPHHRK